MIVDYKSLQWYKDLLFPLVFTIALCVESYYLYQAQGAAAQAFHNSIWFLWSWVGMLALSNLSVFIGVILRKFNKTSYIWFEYPGSIVAGITILVYTGVLLASGNAGPASLSIGITIILAAHYLINFLIIHFSVFHDK